MTRVKPLFLLATMIDGSQVVAEFSEVAGSGENYVAAVFSGRKPFNAWKVVGDTHPASGEKVLVRQRVMLNGKQIRQVIPVQPKAGMETSHSYVATNFEPADEIQSGDYGKWTCPREAPEGAVVGMAYPVHRDEATLEKYVILKAATPTEANPLEGEVRYWIDRNRVTTNGSPFPADAEPVVSGEPADADDDLDDGWGGSDDDE